jgi:outer membrane receptor for ferrienterochelin and colicins
MARGRVVSTSDSAPVANAEIRRLDGAQRVRTGDQGRFAIGGRSGDSIAIRALGFREARVALSGDSAFIRLEPLATVLPTLVTTAGNREIRASETPASMAVIDSRQIAAAGASSVSQVLRQLPGLEEIASPPSRSSIAIRGLDGPRVLVLIDGEPVPGALTDNRDIGRLSTISVERIEVTRGPSSVEFGSDALGGVINVVTTTPTDRFTVDATARTAGLGRRESTGQVSGSRGDFGMRLGGGWRQVDRLAAIDAEGSTLHRVYDARADVRWREHGSFGVRTSGHWTRERQRWPVGGGYNGFVDDIAGQGLVEAHQRSSLGLVRLRLSGQVYSYKYRQAAGDSPIAGSADSLEQQEKVGRALLAWTRAAGAHVFDAGAQYSTRWMAAPDKVEGDSAEDRVAEAYVKDTWTNERWLLTGGARLTSSSVWGSSVTPTAGMAFDVTPSWRLKANVASGFRPPSFKEIRYTFANLAAGYTVLGNEELEPERSVSLSAGAVWAPVSAFSVEGEVYRNDVRKLIDLRFEGVNPAGLQVYRSINVGRARIDGAEFNARVSLGRTDLAAGVNRLRPVDRETGERLSGHAETTALFRLARTWTASSSVITDVSARYTGEATMGTETRGALTSVDAQVRWRVMPRVEVSAGANNLFNAVATLWTPAFERQLFAAVRFAGN